MFGRNDGTGPLYPPTNEDIFIAAGSYSNWIVRLTSCKDITRQQFEWRELDQSKRFKRLLVRTPLLLDQSESRTPAGGETVLRSEGVSYEVGYYCSNFPIT